MSNVLFLKLLFSIPLSISSSCSTTDKQVDSLDGTWQMTRYEEVGEIESEEELKANPRKVVIKGNLFHFTGDGHDAKLTFITDQAKNPARIDFTDPDKKNVNHAIYLMKGDMLTICVSCKWRENREEDRPAKFSSDKKENNDLTGLILMVFKRTDKK